MGLFSDLFCPPKQPKPALLKKPDPRRASMQVKHTLVKRHRRKPLMERIEHMEQSDARPATQAYKGQDSDLPVELFEPAPVAEMQP